MKNSIPHVFCDVLKKRGIVGSEAIEKFFFPSLADLPHPSAMVGLESASDLIAHFILKKKNIVVWGDYDVDGTTATSLLVNFFAKYGIEVIWHIPNRFDEGYGLNMDWFVDNRKRLGAEFLVITVDCGISEKETVESLKRCGGTVVITDHHSIPQDGVPNCLVVNPSQAECGFNGESLAGVGVVFYLVSALRSKFRERGLGTASEQEINLKQFLAFVALGTIADVVPMSATNRILVRGGLEVLPGCEFPGVQALLSSCDIYGEISSEDIGFLLGPKINAAGRLGEGSLVVELLTESDPRKAKQKANRLTELNVKRRTLCEENLDYALTILQKSQVSSNKIIILKGEFHLGVAGIVASRLVENFGVPAIVLAEKSVENGLVKLTGSARSVTGINIIECLSAVSPVLEKYGGHAMAAGMTLDSGNFDELVSRLSTQIKSRWEIRKTIKNSMYDAELPIDLALMSEYVDCLKLFEPFGPGNLPLVFCDPNAWICDAKTVGKNSEHLQVSVRGKYANVKGIGFRLGDKINDVQKEPRRELIYAPTLNRFRGTTSWQVRIIGL